MGLNVRYALSFLDSLGHFLVESFHKAHLSVQVEAGACRVQHRPLPVKACTRLASLLLTSLLSHHLSTVGAVGGAASEAAEMIKHTAFDAEGVELGGCPSPLVM